MVEAVPQTTIRLNGADLEPDLSGALFWRARNTLIVADLHFEKGSALASRGQLLPPYDTRSTLKKLTAVLRRTAAARVISLGDSFHDIHAFERFGDIIDWAMIILNPLEPWPGQSVLPAAKKHEVEILTRVVDYGGLFHGDMKPGHQFKAGDHRSYRPEGWVEAGHERIEKMQDVIDRHGLSLLHFACLWNLSQEPVRSVVPTFIQEAGESARAIEDKIKEFGSLPEIVLSPDDVERVRLAGDNTGCMKLKGASQRHESSERPDEWPMRSELLELAQRYELGSEW